MFQPEVDETAMRGTGNTARRVATHAPRVSGNRPQPWYSELGYIFVSTLLYAPVGIRKHVRTTYTHKHTYIHTWVH